MNIRRQTKAEREAIARAYLEDRARKEAEWREYLRRLHAPKPPGTPRRVPMLAAVAAIATAGLRGNR